jgi:CDP-diacylglycerol---serine O-phosphatidyltransferase
MVKGAAPSSGFASRARMPNPAMDPRLRKTIFFLPNLFTAANLVLGALAVILAFNDALTLRLAQEAKELPFVWSGRLIMIGIFLDFMDGRLARATGSSSRFGMEFDSLADLVSFGVAPAVLLYLAVLRYLPFWGGSIAVLYVVCAAVRLARFNVQADIEEKDRFMGLPTPAAAGLLASYVLLSRWGGWYGKGELLNNVMNLYEKQITMIESTIIPVLAVLVAFMMVSSIRYPSLKRLDREKIKISTLVFVGLMIIWLIKAAEITFFILALIYFFWGPLGGLAKSGISRLRSARTP